MNRSYLISGLDYGIHPLPEHWLSEHSIFWYCVRCGETYAVLRVPGSQAWDGKAGCCEACQPYDSIHWQIPGSIWDETDRARNWALPDRIVEREFYLHINWFNPTESMGRKESETPLSGG